ncbi:MAG: DUF1989 domain-containing protein [Rhodospirillales bacterium]|nr:DUF1989 domain-containing protein [Rhodospirillales bacterium]
MAEQQTVRKAAHVKVGRRIKIINTHGEVVDTGAFNAEDIAEYMAMDTTRAYNQRMSPLVGDDLVTNKHRPILKLVEDTSPGRLRPLALSPAWSRGRSRQLRRQSDLGPDRTRSQ